MREALVQASYLLASVLFILSLKSLSRADTAARGVDLAVAGMAIAIVGTLMQQTIIDYRWIALGLGVGTVVGIPLGTRVPMTAMPQRIAIALTFGASAATLVGIAEYHDHRETLALGQRVAVAFEVMLGSLTVAGSFVAAGKLQEVLPSRPLTYRGQNAVNFGLLAVILVILGAVVAGKGGMPMFYGLVALAFIAGISLVLPIGGADMPVVVALLNSYSGLASAATGFAISNNVLLVSGALDGTSGFLLSMLMSKAMNRSFTNVLFGAFGSQTQTAAVGAGSDLVATPISAEDAAVQLAYASNVVVVPGYGMAVAQAQHQVRELAELIEKRGGEVRYAIHPVAGRMPGHMNVLLAEANIPYDKLYDMDEINGDLSRADVALVIGANDVVNPAARTDPTSPIYGMPILNVDEAKSVIVLKRGMSVGFAGIDNMLFYQPRTRMLFGDAKASLVKLVTEIKAL
ncbi:MAG TPA: NAD(P)(+) transhydrogenase (Re/Si-specific) subunit beta [Gemmatimonadaceae bacterium]|nr:NAD(P)(+) transhydrogenase (Re/Si-specific) subunit beta [Gemmatimonadaceae bacterium]